jgi:hypothetical protein
MSYMSICHSQYRPANVQTPVPGRSPGLVRPRVRLKGGEKPLDQTLDWSKAEGNCVTEGNEELWPPKVGWRATGGESVGPYVSETRFGLMSWRAC